MDKEGNIDFPQLGVIKVQGNDTCRTDKIYQKPVDRKGLVKDPIVTIQFLNFKVSVLGEVNRPGTHFGDNQRPHHLAGRIEPLLATRPFTAAREYKGCPEENGERVAVSLDLRNKDLLSSPYYYLQQNDVVRRTNKVKAGQREINQKQNHRYVCFHTIGNGILCRQLIFK